MYSQKFLQLPHPSPADAILEEVSSLVFLPNTIIGFFAEANNRSAIYDGAFLEMQAPVHCNWTETQPHVEQVLYIW